MRDGKLKLVRLDNYSSVMYNLDENIGETNDLAEKAPEQFQSMKKDLKEWEGGLVEPWWGEGEAWPKVTREIHKALMNNEKPERVHPY